MDNLTETLFDCIVVGSGPSGVMCAQTLVEAGRKVLLVDAGIRGNDETIPPEKNFIEIRKTVYDQQDIFLGKNLEAIQFGSVKSFGQVTAQRQHVFKEILNWMPLQSDTFFPVESLAYEGLGAAWGLGCFAFSEKELEKVGLNIRQMKNAYQVIADRIGIAYTSDDINKYTADHLQSLQPSILIDENSSEMLRRYELKKKYINSKGFFAGIPALALLTKDKDGRKATGYTNMDYYDNPNSSAYRPSVTLKKLQTYSNFAYLPGIFITEFIEEAGIVELKGQHMKSKQNISFKTQKLVLACNVLSTARVVLRSFKKFHIKLPLLCNPYSYMACIQPGRLGKLSSIHKTSTSQLAIFYDKNVNHDQVSMASIYSYSSLMLFRILNEMPLNYRDALSIIRYVQSAIVIAGIHHPDHCTDNKYVELAPHSSTPTGDILKAYYSLSKNEQIMIRSNEQGFRKTLRVLGCFTVKRIFPGFGASAHYAGTLPYNETSTPLTLHPGGLLSATQNVYVADGSGFKYLPAKGLTLTLMANAHNTALNILKNE